MEKENIMIINKKLSFFHMNQLMLCHIIGGWEWGMCLLYHYYIVFNAGKLQCTGKVNFLYPIPSPLISLPDESNMASKVINNILIIKLFASY